MRLLDANIKLESSDGLTPIPKPIMVEFQARI